MNEVEAGADESGQVASPVPGADLTVPPTMLEQIDDVAATRGWSREAALMQILTAGLARLRANGSSSTQAAMPSHGPLAHAAWRAAAPANPDRPLASHEWAENLVPTLPLRFQHYIADLLFDDERILYFLHRPPFRTAARWPWRRRRVHEGLLLITDRMVMLIEDAIPPGPMFIAWGYNAWMTAIERVCGAQVDGQEPVQLRIECMARGGREQHVVPFESAQRGDLSDALVLLNRYAAGGELLPRRTYADDIPRWEAPDARAARARIVGRGANDVAESDMKTAEASSEQGIALLRGMELEMDGRDRSSTDIASMSSIRVWRAMTACTLDVYVPHDARIESRSIVFQYPQSTPFLRIASRLRHLMGRPVAAP